MNSATILGYGKGLELATIGTHAAIVALAVSLIGALIAWLVFHLIAPAYEAIAAVIAFVLLLLVLLLL